MKMKKSIAFVLVSLLLLASCSNEKLALKKSGMEINNSETEYTDNISLDEKINIDSSNCKDEYIYEIPSEIQAYLDINWRTEYKKMVDIYHKDRNVGTPWGMPMYFMDIDNDNIYELIAKIGSYSDGSDLLFIYDYSNSNITYKGVINGGYLLNESVSSPEEYCNKNILDIYFDEKKNTYNIFSSVSYASGGIYGYSFYLSSLDASGIYISEAIGSVYAETANYSPPFNWNYTLGDIDSENIDENEFKEKLQYVLSGKPIETDVLEVRLFADIFMGEDSVSDSDYNNVISSLKREVYSKYFQKQ